MRICRPRKPPVDWKRRLAIVEKAIDSGTELKLAVKAAEISIETYYRLRDLALGRQPAQNRYAPAGIWASTKNHPRKWYQA